MLSKHTGKYEKLSDRLEIEKVIYYCNQRCPFVYIWYDGKEEKFYIGSHNGKSQAYTHSSQRMESFNCFNVPLHMSRKILKIFDNDKECKAFEKKLIRERLSKNPNKYHNVF